MGLTQGNGSVVLIAIDLLLLSIGVAIKLLIECRGQVFRVESRLLQLTPIPDHNSEAQTLYRQ